MTTARQLPDFTGLWLNVSVESPDIDAFLREGLGMNWGARAYAKAQKLGVGKLTHALSVEEITTSEEEMRISVEEIGTSEQIAVEGRGALKAHSPPRHGLDRDGSSASKGGVAEGGVGCGGAPGATPTAGVGASITVQRLVRHTLNIPEAMAFAHVVDGKEHMHPAVGIQPAHAYVCTWEGGALVMRSSDGSIFDLRRSLRADGRMVCELTFPRKGGVSMTRIFERQC